MSRVIQLISHNQHLFALTESGEIFQLRKRRVKCRLEEYWKKLQSPCDTTQPQSEPPETFTKARPIPRPNTIDVMNPAPRRPTSIGSDGNYLPPTGD
jgi:hypothetical protein